MIRQQTLLPASLDDAELIKTVSGTGIAHAPELVAEAGRCRLAAAVSALENLCRRFIRFGSA
jgi:hypothetical protein